MVAPSRWIVSRSSLSGVPGADEQEPARGQVARGRKGGAVALAAELAECRQRRQLAAAAPIELAKGAVERGSPTNGAARTSAATSHG